MNIDCTFRNVPDFNRIIIRYYMYMKNKIVTYSVEDRTVN